MSINSFEDNNVEAETEYFYRVKAEIINFGSEYSNIANIITQQQIPNAPSSISAINNSDGSISLQWIDNSDIENGYLVERSNDNNANFEVLAELELNSTSFTDTEAKPATIYFYRVKAFNQFGESNYSNEIEIETPIGFPIAPTNLEVTVVNDYTAQLTWTDNATNEEAYLVERSVGNADFEQIAELASDSESFEEVLELNQYTYRVVAKNSRGNSDYSNEVSIGEEVLNNNRELSNEIILFPNPAKETVFVKIESNLQINKIQIRNTLGQIIEQEVIIDNNQQIEIPLQSLANGLYLIHITSNKGTIVKQIIVE